jgi:hypothetical protein
MLPSDAKLTVGRATKNLDDPRVLHWWDGDNILSQAFAPVLGIEGEAWDVYLLYDKDTTWGDTPPKPVFWQEQLGISPETQLDRTKLTAEIKKLLGK